MHFGLKRACYCDGESTSGQSISVTPKWIQVMRALFSVTENIFYISLVFLGIVFYLNKQSLVLKVLTNVIEPGSAEAYSKLFSVGRRRVKRLHSSCVSTEFGIQVAVPMGGAVLF